MKYSKKTQHALKAYTTLVRASESVLHWSAEQFREHDLTISQFGVLEALYHLGSMTQAQLGEKILKSSGNMTLVIDNLEKCGWVERKRCQKDRRRYFIELTEEGQKKIEGILPGHLRKIEERMSVLSSSELEMLRDCLKRVGKQ